MRAEAKCPVGPSGMSCSHDGQQIGIWNNYFVFELVGQILETVKNKNRGRVLLLHPTRLTMVSDEYLDRAGASSQGTAETPSGQGCETEKTAGGDITRQLVHGDRMSLTCSVHYKHNAHRHVLQ